MKGYFERLTEAKEKYGDITVACDGEQTMRYSDLLTAVCGYGNILAGMGVKPGDKVALCAYNSCSWLKAFFGITCYGAVAVLMNYSLPENEIMTLMTQMDAEFFLYGNFGSLKRMRAVWSVFSRMPGNGRISGRFPLPKRRSSVLFQPRSPRARIRHSWFSPPARQVLQREDCCPREATSPARMPIWRPSPK